MDSVVDFYQVLGTVENSFIDFIIVSMIHGGYTWQKWWQARTCCNKKAAAALHVFSLLPASAGILAYFSTLKLEVICYSDMSGCLQTKWRYNPEDCAQLMGLQER
jgi:hypothetical protein